MYYTVWENEKKYCYPNFFSSNQLFSIFFIFLAQLCGKVHENHIVEKREIHCQANFFPSNQFIVNFLSKTLLWRNFCGKIVAVKFCNFHSVKSFEERKTRFFDGRLWLKIFSFIERISCIIIPGGQEGPELQCQCQFQELPFQLNAERIGHRCAFIKNTNKIFITAPISMTKKYRRL